MEIQRPGGNKVIKKRTGLVENAKLLEDVDQVADIPLVVKIPKQKGYVAKESGWEETDDLDYIILRLPNPPASQLRLLPDLHPDIVSR